VTGERVTRVLCAAEPRGSAECIQRLAPVVTEQNVEAICLVGDLAGAPASTQGFRSVFQALGDLDVPTYWVPGPDDAPVGDYLSEAHHMEMVFPNLHGVHGTAAFTPDAHTVIAGLGGEISDDPRGARDEIEHLRYPRWEPEYQLKLLRELDEHQLVMAFATPPAHKGAAHGGSEAVTELIGTYRPRALICGGGQMNETIGRTVVVAPGSLQDGKYAIVEVNQRDVVFGDLAQAG
jgi:Icc-related predicted phosphoesterase